MEEIFNAKVENINLPFEHCFINQNVWVKIIDNGKFVIAKDKDFEHIIEQFQIIDSDVKIGITKCKVKDEDFAKTYYPIIEIEKKENEIIIKLYKSGYPNSPITIKKLLPIITRVSLGLKDQQ